MTSTKRNRGRPSAEEDERLNDRFHALLRDAADEREDRTRVHSMEDAEAARQESAELLALAKDQASGSPERATHPRPSPPPDSRARVKQPGRPSGQR